MKIRIATATALLLTTAFAWAGQDFIAKMSEPHGVLVSNVEQSTQKLFPVTIQAINGETIAGRDMGLYLKPGQYSITVGNARVDPQLAGATGYSSRNQHTQNEIELNVEAGKTYYLAMKADGSDREQWKVVNWKTEER